MLDGITDKTKLKNPAAASRRSWPRRILKWIIAVPGLIVVVVGCVLLVFDLLAHHREKQTIVAAAPHSGRLVQTRDALLFVQEEGPSSGQNVVLVHGTGAWSELWRDTIDPLANAGFRVTAIDLPPFGFSEKLKGGPQAYSVDKQAQRMLDVLDTLRVDHPAIVCHSVGCRPVVELALQQPEKVGRLVLVDPALGFATDQTNPHYDRNSPGFLMRSFFFMRSFRNAVIATYGTNPRSIQPIFNSFVFNHNAVTERRLKVLQEPLVLQGMTNAEADWFEHLMAINDPAASANFGNFSKIAAPTSMIWGRQDTVTPLWQAQALLILIPNSRLRVIENAGHIPYIENTQQFNEVLVEVLGGNHDALDGSVKSIGRSE